MDNLAERARLTDVEIAQAAGPHSLESQRLRAVADAQLQKALRAAASILYDIDSGGRESWAGSRLSFLADEIDAMSRGVS